MLIEAIIIFLLILLNGFFATSEIAIISSRRSVVEKFAKDGKGSARLVSKMKDEPERFLATIQVGVTLIGTLASVIGGVVAIEFLKPIYRAVPFGPVQDMAELLAVGTVVILISYAMLIVGELVPKSLALRYSERIAFVIARPIELVSRMFSPFVRVLTASTTFLLRLIGIKEGIKEVLIPREELKYYIKESRERGVLQETEAQLLHGVFEFADTTVKEIMVPKPKFCAIEIDTPPEEVLKLVAETGFSRYPVYRETMDNMVGILFNKDLFRAIEQKKTIVLRELVRPPFFVPNTIMISTLLRDMQKRKTHIAIVVDEHGDVDGLVTIEDILEEIVGEIEDEYDVEKGGLVERLRNGTMVIDASASLKDLKEIGLPFSEEDLEEYNTLAGFMLSKLQRIPRGGEFVIHSGYRFTVVDMEKNRIAKVKVESMHLMGRMHQKAL